jgi:hypothetical protein
MLASFGNRIRGLTRDRGAGLVGAAKVRVARLQTSWPRGSREPVLESHYQQSLPAVDKRTSHHRRPPTSVPYPHGSGGFDLLGSLQCSRMSPELNFVIFTIEPNCIV